jgi:hypothetical protein
MPSGHRSCGQRPRFRKQQQTAKESAPSGSTATRQRPRCPAARPAAAGRRRTRSRHFCTTAVAAQVGLARLRWSPGPGRRSRRRSAVRTRGHRTRPAGHRGPGIADARDRGRGMRTLRQRPVGQPAAKPSTAACMSGRQRDRKVRHRPTPPWPDRQIVAWCSVSIWSAPDGSGLLILGASSVASGPDGSRRIVWRINRMIKRGRQLDSLTAADLDSAVDPHPPTW